MTTLIQPPHNDRLLVSGPAKAPAISDQDDRAAEKAVSGEVTEASAAGAASTPTDNQPVKSPVSGERRTGRPPYNPPYSPPSPPVGHQPLPVEYAARQAVEMLAAQTIDRPAPPPDFLAWPTVDQEAPSDYEVIRTDAESGGVSDVTPETVQVRARRSHRRRSVKLLMTVCAGVMALVMGDILAATLSVPQLGGPGFTSPATDTQWVVLAFALPYAAILPIAGRIADAMGARRLLTVGLFVFALAAAIAMEAPTWEALLAARAVQGLGAALMVPASLALLLATVSPARQTAAVGVWSAATGLAGIVAYTAGGWAGETLHAGWRVLFVPSAVAGAFLLCLAVTLPKPKPRTGPLPDFLGGLLLAAGLGAITWTIVTAPRQGWDTVTIACAAGGVLLLIAAALRSRRHAEPALDFALWRTGRYAVAAVVSALYGLVSFPLLVIAPLYLATVWEGPAEWLGAALVPVPAGILIASVAGAKIAKRYGPRPIFYVGSLAVAGACLALLRFAFKGGYDLDLFQVWLPTGVALGFGFGLLQTGTAAAATLTTDPGRYATGLGASLSAWQIGGIAGLTATTFLLDQEPGSIPVSGYVAAVSGCLVVSVLAGWVGLFFRPGAARPSPRTEARRDVGDVRREARPSLTRGRPQLALPQPAPMPLSAPVPQDMMEAPTTIDGVPLPLGSPIPLAFISQPTATVASLDIQPDAPIATPEADPAPVVPYEATAAMLQQMKATTKRIDTLAEALLTYLDTTRERDR